MNRIKQILIYILVLLLSCVFAYDYYTRRDLGRRFDEVKKWEEDFNRFVAEVNDLVREKKRLEEEINRLKEDQLKQEELVRRMKGWVYPGEKVFRLEETQ